jgi:hypothetical protein
MLFLLTRLLRAYLEFLNSCLCVVTNVLWFVRSIPQSFRAASLGNLAKKFGGVSVVVKDRLRLVVLRQAHRHQRPPQQFPLSKSNRDRFYREVLVHLGQIGVALRQFERRRQTVGTHFLLQRDVHLDRRRSLACPVARAQQPSGRRGSLPHSTESRVRRSQLSTSRLLGSDPPRRSRLARTGQIAH